MKPGSDRSEVWELFLYIAGETPRSVIAFQNLKDICNINLAGRYTIEVINLMKNPILAEIDQIVAIPTLVRKLPNPVRKIIGDLSNTEKTLIGLQIHLAKLKNATQKDHRDAS